MQSGIGVQHEHESSMSPCSTPLVNQSAPPVAFNNQSTPPVAFNSQSTPSGSYSAHQSNSSCASDAAESRGSSSPSSIVSEISQISQFSQSSQISSANTPTSVQNHRSTSSHLSAEKQASLANKFRLSKTTNVNNSVYANAHQAVIGGEEDDGRSDIRVLSPSLVNSQVLSKTRPLSPDPETHLPNGDIVNCYETKITGGRGKPRAKDTRKGGGGGGLGGGSGSVMGVGPQQGREGKGPDGGDLPQDEDQKGGKGRGRGRRRQRLFKLKFHHQALPPEYLDHYEASLRQQQRASLQSTPAGGHHPPPPGHSPQGVSVGVGHGGHALHHPHQQPHHAHHPQHEAQAQQPHQPTPELHAPLQAGAPRRRGGRGGVRGPRGQPRPITIHEAGGGATEALLRDLLLTRPHLQEQAVALQQAALARAQSVPSLMLSSTRSHSHMYQPVGSGEVEEMPYVGGDFLVDTRHRRGRKPRRSDGAPQQLQQQQHSSSCDMEPPPSLTPEIVADDTLVGACRVPGAQLRQQYERLGCESLTRSKSYSLLQSALTGPDQQEPLNLCLRDLHGSVKAEDTAEEEDMREMTPRSSERIEVKVEPAAADLEDEGSSLYPEYRIPLPPRPEALTPGGIQTSRTPGPRTPGSPSDYLLWPPTMVPPLAQPWLSDYRLKPEDGLSSGHSTPSLCSQSSHLPSLSPPAFPHLSPPPPGSSPHSPSPAPPRLQSPHQRHIQALLKESVQQRLEEAARETLGGNGVEGSVRAGVAGKNGARRKRSALFIPPADNSTEVSICKFKFTGGPNPVLEEKKMVRVDAGGNLRYYSGGERGGRDTRQGGNSHMRLSGKFLETMSKCEKDVKKIRLESDTEDSCSLSGLRLPGLDLGGPSSASAAASPVGTLERDGYPPSFEHLGPAAAMAAAAEAAQQQNEESPKRKRRSKKAAMREKLEQTFRERGFLIQTQQVESAEGATYCKFRQLRKFTRYLFRSWKDHLPGQLRDQGGVLPPGVSLGGPGDGFASPLDAELHLQRGAAGPQAYKPQPQ